MELAKVQLKKSKRIGRGLSAGQGKTAGRGTKGQKSRSGYNLPNRYAGGESPLSLRLPKLPGFKSHKQKAIVITLDVVSRNFKNGEIVSKETLLAKKLIKKGQKAKVLNTGELTINVTFADNVKLSGSVSKIIELKKSVVADKPAIEKAEAKKTVPAKKATTEKPKTTPKKAAKKA